MKRPTTSENAEKEAIIRRMSALPAPFLTWLVGVTEAAYVQNPAITADELENYLQTQTPPESALAALRGMDRHPKR